MEIALVAEEPVSPAYQDALSTVPYGPSSTSLMDEVPMNFIR